MSEAVEEQKPEIKVETKGLNIHPNTFRKILERTDGHCPCVVKSARNEDTLCLCKEYRETGKCRCGYYDPLRAS